MKSYVNRFHIEASKMSNAEQSPTLAIFCLCIKTLLSGSTVNNHLTPFDISGVCPVQQHSEKSLNIIQNTIKDK